MENEVNAEEESNAQRWVRLLRRQSTQSQKKSVGHRYSASIICEFLFRYSKQIMSGVMDRHALEVIIILKYNKDLWDAREIL